MDRERGLLSKKWTGVDRDRERELKTGKNVRTFFMNDLYAKHVL